MNKCSFHQVTFCQELKRQIEGVNSIYERCGVTIDNWQQKGEEVIENYIMAVKEILDLQPGGRLVERISEANFLPFFLNRWIYARRPFYRIYPGVIEALKKFDITRVASFEESSLLGPVMIELPKGYEIDDSQTINNITNIFLDVYYHKGKKNIYMSHAIGGHINENWGGFEGTADKLDAYIKENFTKENVWPSLALVAGVLFLDNQPGLFDPVVLKKDILAYENARTEEDRAKYIQRAKNRGLVGYEIGKNIPTKAEFTAMKRENEDAVKQGKKIPHIRCGHLHTYWTGQGRSTPKLKYVNATLVNFDGIFDVPNGYYN